VGRSFTISLKYIDSAFEVVMVETEKGKHTGLRTLCQGGNLKAGDALVGAVLRV